MSPWTWLVIIFVIIVIVWFLVSRPSKTQTTDIQPHDEEAEAHPPEALKAVEAVLAVPAGQADDLVSLEGIGPKINSLLNEA